MFLGFTGLMQWLGHWLVELMKKGLLMSEMSKKAKLLVFIYLFFPVYKSMDTSNTLLPSITCQYNQHLLFCRWLHSFYLFVLTFNSCIFFIFFLGMPVLTVSSSSLIHYQTVFFGPSVIITPSITQLGCRECFPPHLWGI